MKRSLKNNPFSRLFDTISSCMNPVIPVLMAAGILKLLIILIGYTGLFTLSPQTEDVLSAVSNAAFYFLPVFTAYSSACHFRVNPHFAMACAAVLLLPDFIELLSTQEKIRFLFLPVYKASYAFSVLPAILLVYVLSKLTGSLEKVSNKTFRTFFLPVITITFTSIIGILFVGPLCTIIGNGISAFIFELQEINPVLSWAVFSALSPFLTMTGTSWIFTAIVLESLGNTGMEIGYMVSSFICVTAIAGVALGAYFNEPGSPERHAYLSAGLVALFAGITEPALYGICIPKKSLLAVASAASFAGGIYQGIFTPCSTVYSFPSVSTVLMFYQEGNPSNLFHAISAAAIGFITALALTIAVKYIRGPEQRGQAHKGFPPPHS